LTNLVVSRKEVKTMKKVATISLVIVGLLISGFAYADWMGGCNEYRMPYGQSTNIDSLKSFQRDTLPVRDEVMTKNAEVQNEYGKATPDYKKIATLQKEIIDLRTKIQVAADKYGVASWGPMSGGMGPSMMGVGAMGPGMTGSNSCRY
jgi:zinc resistance-associated protein